MKTKVRVVRRDLLKIVEGRVRKAENEHKRAVTAYPVKVEAWNKARVMMLTAAAAKAERGGKFEYNRVQLPDEPIKPSEGRELCNLRRMLATLKIGAEDTILLSQEDADWYFGECRI